MNISSRTAFQVGLLVFGGFCVLVGGWIFLNGLIRTRATYPITFTFHDAQGVTAQADVTLAGVKVGTVSSAGLSPDGRLALVHCEIDKHRAIPVGSRVTIAAGILGGSATVAIMPPPPPPPGVPEGQVAYLQPHQTIAGDEAFSLQAFSAQAGGLLRQFATTSMKANQLLDQATKTTESINNIVGNPQVQLTLMSTLQNLNKASANGLQTTQALQEDLRADNAQIQSSLDNVNSMTASLMKTTQGNSGHINQIVENLNQSSTQLNELMTHANTTLTQGQTMEKLSDSVNNLHTATVKLDSIMGNISSVTGNPQVQADLEQTVHNAAVASANTKELVQRLNAITGGGHPHTPGHGNLAFLTRLNFSQNLRENHFRTDFDLYAPLSSQDFARAGINDLTETNHLNLQYGKVSPYNRLFTYRAGVYDGQVGIGADYDLFGGNPFSIDLYDPNRLRLDARQTFRVNTNFGIWLGLEDVPRTNAVTVGVQLQR
jgi:phospholipid/cholesterol/gamma-HCH transport system substrate-binding protein